MTDSKWRGQGGMKIYTENYFTIIEIEQARFDEVQEHVIEEDDWKKYLICNDVAVKYLSELWDIREDEICRNEFIEVSLVKDE
jgi:hypothetical protein